MRKDERAMKPLDELIVWYERQRLSRTRMDAASRAEQDRKSRETREFNFQSLVRSKS
jgi:hypothetical protein